MIHFKEIHIGSHLKEMASIKNLCLVRAGKFLKCTPKDIEDAYRLKTMETDTLMRWCKLLDYNFFMLYHTHLQIYQPRAATTNLNGTEVKGERVKYVFKKNLYTPEIIDWLLRKLAAKELSIQDVIQKYNIPKTTIYRWKRKF